jgi:hypothetical protein
MAVGNRPNLIPRFENNQVRRIEVIVPNDINSP